MAAVGALHLCSEMAYARAMRCGGNAFWGTLLAVACGIAGAAEPALFALTSEVTRNLALRGEPATSGRRIGELPAGARGIENKGCRGASDIAWDHLSPELRAAMEKERWCRVRYRGKQGWVSAKFLQAYSGPSEGEPDSVASAAPAGGKPVGRSDAPFTGVEWRIATLGNIEIREPTAWIRFTEAGDVEGHSGCNRFRASFVAGTTALRIGPLAMTRMACTDEKLAAQERLLVAALEAAEAQQTAGGVLQLHDASGITRAQFRAAKP